MVDTSKAGLHEGLYMLEHLQAWMSCSKPEHICAPFRFMVDQAPAKITMKVQHKFIELVVQYCLASCN